ncbi:MAG TPA: hypothetical protein VK629_17135 [Steroidobacteraceae bacterium]|nr:hypothetical protein [Steroidobacteraceae bacterium]
MGEISGLLCKPGNVSLTRLYGLRALYLIWAVGLASKVWPRFLPPDLSMPVMDTVVNSVLAGLSLTALLGIRYPLKMLPLLLFEIAWKSIWLIAFGAPLWRNGHLDPQTTEVFKAVMTVVFFPLAVPWRYVFERYVEARGERWK